MTSSATSLPVEFQVVALLFSLFAVSLSAISLYKSNLESARLEVHIGDRLYIVAPAGTRAPINTTLEIVNFGAKAGVLQFLELRVFGPNGGSERFEWSEFYRYRSDSPGRIVEKESDPHPIAVGGKGGRSVNVQFVMAPESPTDYAWAPGAYQLILNGWQGRPSRRYPPNIASQFSFYLSEGEADRLNITKPGDSYFQIPLRIREWS